MVKKLLTIGLRMPCKAQSERVLGTATCSLDRAEKLN